MCHKESFSFLVSRWGCKELKNKINAPCLKE